MAWYFILLIVIACLLGFNLLLFGLLFVVFKTNGDGKMIEKIYDMLSHYHDKQDKEGKI